MDYGCGDGRTPMAWQRRDAGRGGGGGGRDPLERYEAYGAETPTLQPRRHSRPSASPANGRRYGGGPPPTPGSVHSRQSAGVASVRDHQSAAGADHRRRNEGGRGSSSDR